MKITLSLRFLGFIVLFLLLNCYFLVRSSFAIDLRLHGQWKVLFEYGENASFAGGGSRGQGYGLNSEDRFKPWQGLKLSLDATLDAVTANLLLEIKEQAWGKAAQGAAIGADGNQLGIKAAYLDWQAKNQPWQLRLGLQNFALPSTTAGSQILDDFLPGLSLGYHKDQFDLTLFWARPYNDSSEYRHNYLDNVDLFALVGKWQNEKLQLSPWAMYALIAPYSFIKNNAQSTQSANSLSQKDFWGGIYNTHLQAGLLPASGSLKNTSSQYSNALWLGLTGKYEINQDWSLAFDANFGYLAQPNNQSADRWGYLGSILLEYQGEWMKPGFFAWYGSGDDSKRKNGSERMPYLSTYEAVNKFSPYAFNGNPILGRDSVIGNSFAGTWGVGIKLDQIAVVEDILQRLSISYIRGTNDLLMGKQLKALGYSANSGSNGVLGMDNLYLTYADYALEFSLCNMTKVFENFTVYLQAAYTALWLDKPVWGGSPLNGFNSKTHDAWNISFGYVFDF